MTPAFPVQGVFLFPGQDLGKSQRLRPLRQKFGEFSLFNFNKSQFIVLSSFLKSYLFQNSINLYFSLSKAALFGLSFANATRKFDYDRNSVADRDIVATIAEYVCDAQWALYS